MGELSNKVAIVTGSTKGIGKSIAEVFSQKGAHVVVTSRNLSSAKAIVDGLASYETDPIAIKTDVTNDDDVSNLIQTTKNHYGKIDILINNAGFPLVSEYWDSSFNDIDVESFKNVIDADLIGSIRCCKAVIPVMKESNSGNIVNISSTPAIAGHDKGSPYTIAKAGLLGLTKHLALEYGKYNIRTNCLALGNIKSSATFDHFDNETQQKLANEASVKRWGEPIDVANICSNLVTDDFSFVNGQTIVVDGGNVLL